MEGLHENDAIMGSQNHAVALNWRGESARENFYRAMASGHEELC
jgi:hypothetical protein